MLCNPGNFSSVLRSSFLCPQYPESPELTPPRVTASHEQRGGSLPTAGIRWVSADYELLGPLFQPSDYRLR